MSSNRNLLLTGAVATILAVAILAGFLATGLLPVSPSSKPPTISQNGERGTLTILLTDPPVIPEGVSSVLLTYSGISLHRFGGSPADWVSINVTGTVDLLKIINVSKTIAVSVLPADTYDKIILNISEVHAIYLGKNISADLNDRQIIISPAQSINVYSSSNVTILIDLQTNLLNINTEASPRLLFSATAWCAPLPVSAENIIVRNVGGTSNLTNSKWFSKYVAFYAPELEITSASITYNSLSVTVMNTGNASTILHYVIVNPVSQPSMIMPNYSSKRMPLVIPAFVTIQVFNILPNGTLAAFSVTENCSLSCVEGYNTSGYLLKPGDSVTLTYISKSGVLPLLPSIDKEYIITVIATGAEATTIVKAEQ